MIIRFDQIEAKVSTDPGLYEIYTTEDIPLKVGVAKNLKKRLMQHAHSMQSALKIIHGLDEPCPEELLPRYVESKQSILAKHLFFDSKITNEYDLTTEPGRQSFLKACCYLKVTLTGDREKAREIEKELEAKGVYRYAGKVIQR